MEPLRYHFDDLEKQVRRRPMGIDLQATMEILHKNLARIEQELGSMRERVDMELLLRNDSLSDENLPLPGDTPPVEDESSPQVGEVRSSATRSQSRSFSATGDPFEMPSPSDDRATRADDRSSDDTLFLKPVKLAKSATDDKILKPAEPVLSASRHDSEATETKSKEATGSRRELVRDLSMEKTRMDRSNDETLVVERANLQLD